MYPALVGRYGVIVTLRTGIIESRMRQAKTRNEKCRTERHIDAGCCCGRRPPARRLVL
jgi:hypothetical protein